MRRRHILIALSLVVVGAAASGETRGEAAVLAALRASCAPTSDVDEANDGRGLAVEWLGTTNDGALRTLRGLKRLAVLRVLEGDISDEALKRLRGHLNLTVVVVKSARVTDEGLRALCTLPKLSKVDLMGARLTSKGLSRLSRLPSLRRLYLHGSQLEGDFVTALRALTRLEVLTLPERATNVEVEALKKALPRADVSKALKEDGGSTGSQGYDPRD